ncbi:RNA 2',3'-cyclic phosphodiesterase [Sphingomonas japonica]|uniref:RNA 2',3'-cyclic phosphodiesterase n=1 Tax=Sphingomonas japonica TaxID=511662 RepID=A0ABX0TWM9_9SPHN|nr:RNA 2',3'-cyclic phosphodiesterase [Sphingomonas japonica]NIJ22719.1 2'-5' RNA ligase [Sphingomonas japonica]
MHRLFVALRPPPDIRARLIAAMGDVPGARWQDDEQLHITLRFVGEVDARTADDITVALAAVRFPKIVVALNGVGTFTKRSRVNAIWAGVAPHDALAALHRKIDHAIVRAGQPPERRAYLPHITLARLGASAGPSERFVAEHTAMTSAPFALEHFTLFESHLGSDGARYVPIERYPLG